MPRSTMPRSTTAAAVFAAIVLSLAGCSGDGGEDTARSSDPSAGATASPSTSAPGESPSPTPTPTPPPSATDAASASVTAPPSARPSPVPTAGQRQKLVTMTVTGGFAGVQQEVILRGDGTVRTSDKGDTDVRRTSAAQFTRLCTLLGDPALDGVPASTVDAGAADLFQYTLRFDGRTVVTDRSAERPPLDRLIDALGKWLPA
ncbi:hypothetical protein ACFU9Y_00100 [Streptomyces sp. NPDC057621]|uniref:hypothetical protein n=1 Tax=Streptomyces sp. NPDC057621 TaxID=3346186 RepID=UPI0036997CDB